MEYHKGRLLFILYINDLANVSDKLKFMLFADDTNGFFSLVKDIKNVCNVLNKELENTSIWFEANLGCVRGQYHTNNEQTQSVEGII